MSNGDEPKGPKPPLPETAKIETHWAGPNGTKSTNIMYAQNSSFVGALTDLETIAGLVLAGIKLTAGILHLVSNLLTLVDVTAIDNTGATENVFADVDGSPGGEGFPNMPPQVCVTTSWRINARYRGGHPRTYWMGATENQLSTPGSNQITQASAALWQTAALDLLNNVQGPSGTPTGWHLGTISFYKGHALRPTPIFYPYQGVLVDVRLDTQRRRLGKAPALLA